MLLMWWRWPRTRGSAAPLMNCEFSVKESRSVLTDSSLMRTTFDYVLNWDINQTEENQWKCLHPPPSRPLTCALGSRFFFYSSFNKQMLGHLLINRKCLIIKSRWKLKWNVDMFLVSLHHGAASFRFKLWSNALKTMINLKVQQIWRISCRVK